MNVVSTGGAQGERQGDSWQLERVGCVGGGGGTAYRLQDTIAASARADCIRVPGWGNGELPAVGVKAEVGGCLCAQHVLHTKTRRDL